MPDTAYGTIIPLNEDSSYEMLEAEKAKLRKLGEWMAIDLERRWMVWGVPGQEIVRIARQEHVDLIMVGSHGRHGLALLWDQRRTACCIMPRAMSWQSASRKRLSVLHRYGELVQNPTG